MLTWTIILLQGQDGSTAVNIPDSQIPNEFEPANVAATEDMHESSMSDDQSGLDNGSLAEDHCTEALPSFGVIAGDVQVVRDFVFRSSSQKWYYDLDHNGGVIEDTTDDIHKDDFQVLS